MCDPHIYEDLRSVVAGGDANRLEEMDFCALLNFVSGASFRERASAHKCPRHYYTSVSCQSSIPTTSTPGIHGPEHDQSVLSATSPPGRSTIQDRSSATHCRTHAARSTRSGDQRNRRDALRTTDRTIAPRTPRLEQPRHWNRSATTSAKATRSKQSDQIKFWLEIDALSKGVDHLICDETWKYDPLSFFSDTVSSIRCTRGGGEQFLLKLFQKADTASKRVRIQKLIVARVYHDIYRHEKKRGQTQIVQQLRRLGGHAHRLCKIFGTDGVMFIFYKPIFQQVSPALLKLGRDELTKSDAFQRELRQCEGVTKLIVEALRQELEESESQSTAEMSRSGITLCSSSETEVRPHGVSRITLSSGLQTPSDADDDALPRLQTMEHGYSSDNPRFLTSQLGQRTVLRCGELRNKSSLSYVLIPEADGQFGDITDIHRTTGTILAAPFDLGSMVDHVLRLIRMFGGRRVLKCLLTEGLSPQKRWDRGGDMIETTILNRGLDGADTRNLLDRAIEDCVAQGIVERFEQDGQVISYSLFNKVADFTAGEEISQKHVRLALSYIAYIFPREEALHGSFRSLGKKLLPYLKKQLEQVLWESWIDMSNDTRELIVEALLAASNLVTSPGDIDPLLSRAQQLSEKDVSQSLQLQAIVRRSVTLRAQNNVEESESILETAAERFHIRPVDDVPLDCWYSRLLLSRMENAILRGHLSCASNILEEWDRQCKQRLPSMELSCMELQVLRLKNTVHGRLSRYQGDFENAQRSLEICLGPSSTESGYHHVLHHLGDTYCERSLPQKAEELLKDHIGPPLETHKQGRKAFRRLQLSWIECNLLLNRYDETVRLALGLQSEYEEMRGHDPTDQLGHVRCLLSLARAHWHRQLWPQALSDVQSACQLVQGYSTFIENGYYDNVVYRFHAVLLLKLGRQEDSREFLRLAGSCDQKAQHFIPGMGTYVHEELNATLSLLHPGFQ